MRRVYLAGLMLAGLVTLGGCAPASRPAGSAQSQSLPGAQAETLSIEDADGTLLAQISVYRPDAMALVPGAAGKAIAAHYAQVLAADQAWWQGELADFARDDRAQADRMGEPFRPYVVQERFEIMRNDADFLSILRVSQNNTGGVHDNQTLACETFRKSDGSLVLLEDLFAPGVDFQQALLQWVTDEIARRQNEGSAGYYDDVQALAAQEFDARNFYLTDENLVLVYPVYTLAPYAAGAQYFEIPLSALQDIFV